MSASDVSSARDRWARLRLLIIGQLLAAPPARGELKQHLTDLSNQSWRHPIHGGDVRFGVSTLERWLALARRSPDPTTLLATVSRADAGCGRVIGTELAEAIRAQYAEHPKWNIQLHYDNLKLALNEGELPSYATVLRFFRAEGLWRQREPVSGPQRAAVPDGTREVRSFEATHIGALFHLDGHQGSLKVLNRHGEWITPIALCVIDDCSRLICHLQWYAAHENTECLVHCVSQALQRRGLPRTIYSEYVPWHIFAVMFPVSICGELVCKTGLVRPPFDISPHNSGEDDLPSSLLFGRLSCSRFTLLSQKPSTEFRAIG